MPEFEAFPPKEALAWFKKKGLKPAFDYRDVWKEEHANAFTVAKMLNADLLVDVRQLVENAIAEGQTFQQFAAVLKPLLVKSGWWGVQLMDDPLTGEAKPVQLGSEGRLKIIYRTNMRTARAAG
ncbi:MAG: phage minor head protein, partial [Plesiomonas shigelloides]